MKGWIWKSVVAGFAGTIVHFLFMHFKSWTSLLPAFQPYQSFQIALSHWVGANVPAIVPWALSFLNGMTILGFLFARTNRLLPGKTGAAKGIIFGFIGWIFMGLVFFPLIGLGPFAISSGFGPAVLSLVICRPTASWRAWSMSRSMRETRDRRRNNDVRFGSEADIETCPTDVLLYPKSGHG